MVSEVSFWKSLGLYKNIYYSAKVQSHICEAILHHAFQTTNHHGRAEWNLPCLWSWAQGTFHSGPICFGGCLLKSHCIVTKAILSLSCKTTQKWLLSNTENWKESRGFQINKPPRRPWTSWLGGEGHRQIYYSEVISEKLWHNIFHGECQKSVKGFSSQCIDINLGDICSVLYMAAGNSFLLKGKNGAGLLFVPFGFFFWLLSCFSHIRVSKCLLVIL